MASSLPTIRYEEGGVPEIITPGTGILGATERRRCAGRGSCQPSMTTRRAAIALGKTDRQRVVTAFRPSDAAQAFADVVRLVSGAGGG